jgi:hypothetical protein
MSTTSDRAQGQQGDASSRDNTDRRPLVVGDTVRIAKGTLAWSAEKILRDKVGEVVSTHHVDGGAARVTVRFSARKILERREMRVFERIDGGST